jgi:hypothetical protein
MSDDKNSELSWAEKMKRTQETKTLENHL